MFGSNWQLGTLSVTGNSQIDGLLYRWLSTTFIIHVKTTFFITTQINTNYCITVYICLLYTSVIMSQNTYWRMSSLRGSVMEIYLHEISWCRQNLQPSLCHIELHCTPNHTHVHAPTKGCLSTYAVSYTHLDVYKRQKLPWLISISFRINIKSFFVKNSKPKVR